MINWNDISKKEFDVPAGYFDQLTSSIEKRIEEEVFTTQRTKILKKRFGKDGKVRRIIWSALASAAVVVLGWFILKMNQLQSPSQMVEFDTVLDSTALNEEEVILLLSEEDMAYFFEEEIAELPAFEISENDIKPNRDQDSQSLDSLTSEEILEYLIESDIDFLEMQ